MVKFKIGDRVNANEKNPHWQDWQNVEVVDILPLTETSWPIVCMGLRENGYEGPHEGKLGMFFVEELDLVRE